MDLASKRGEIIENGHPMAEDSKRSGGKPDCLSKSSSSPPEECESLEIACMEKLFSTVMMNRLGIPLTSDELLKIGWAAFEPLFREPPVGPIPEYLCPHLSVHGCVAEYEDQLEELDRWKALKLGGWLNDRVGKRWCVAAKLYEVEKECAAGSEKFIFRLVQDRTGFNKLTAHPG